MSEPRGAFLQTGPDEILRDELPASPLRDEPEGRILGPWRVDSDAIAWLVLTDARLYVAHSGAWVIDPPKHVRALVVLSGDDPIPDADLEAWRDLPGVEAEGHCDAEYRWFFYVDPKVGVTLRRRLETLLRSIAHGKNAIGGRPRRRAITSADIIAATANLRATRLSLRDRPALCRWGQKTEPSGFCDPLRGRHLLSGGSPSIGGGGGTI